MTASVNDAKYANYVLGSWFSGVRAFSPSTTDAVDDVLIGTGTGAIVLPSFTAPALPATPPGTLTRIFARVAKMKLSFFKYNHMGVYIECRRGAGAFEFLAIDTESPYMDERPLLVVGQPEVREYRMRFWDKGTPNGDWTDVVKVTVSP